MKRLVDSADGEKSKWTGVARLELACAREHALRVRVSRGFRANNHFGEKANPAISCPRPLRVRGPVCIDREAGKGALGETSSVNGDLR